MVYCNSSPFCSAQGIFFPFCEKRSDSCAVVSLIFTGYYSISRLSFKPQFWRKPLFCSSCPWVQAGAQHTAHPPVPVGALGGDAQAGWGTTDSIFSLTEILLCLHKFRLEIFSFPVYSKELSKLEKLLKQELFSPLDQVMLYSVFN